MNRSARRLTTAALALAAVAGMACAGAPSAANAAVGATVPVEHVGGFKGPSGNTVSSWCRQHLSDDTPDAAHLPDRAFDCQLQWAAARFDYTGPVDGALGHASWSGVQRYLDDVGTYSGRITGRLDAETDRAIERKAARAPGRYRYTGRIGGSPSQQAWRGFAYFVDLPWSG